MVGCTYPEQVSRSFVISTAGGSSFPVGIELVEGGGGEEGGKIFSLCLLGMLADSFGGRKNKQGRKQSQLKAQNKTKQNKVSYETTNRQTSKTMISVCPPPGCSFLFIRVSAPASARVRV